MKFLRQAPMYDAHCSVVCIFGDAQNLGGFCPAHSVAEATTVVAVLLRIGIVRCAPVGVFAVQIGYQQCDGFCIFVATLEVEIQQPASNGQQAPPESSAICVKPRAALASRPSWKANTGVPRRANSPDLWQSGSMTSSTQSPINTIAFTYWRCVSSNALVQHPADLSHATPAMHSCHLFADFRLTQIV